MRQIKRIQHFVAALSMGLLLSVVTPLAGLAQAAQTSTRQNLFTEAAAEFGVPSELLLSISYNQSRWENHNGKPSVAGGYGLMHLTTQTEQEDGRGDPARPLPERTLNTLPRTLDEAASEIKATTDALKQDDKQNVRGAAALLAKYAKEAQGGVLPKNINDWYASVVRLSGMSDQAKAQAFADDVYSSIKQGLSDTTLDGQKLQIAAQDVTPNKSGVPQAQTFRAQDVPQPECPQTLVCKFVPARFAQNVPTNPKDYGNYDTANRPHDMKIKYIVIHDTEGSYQSAISWFQDPRSYVAAHYVIRSSDGEVTQMVKNTDVGWHAGNWYMNMHSIGIEHEGYAEEGGQWYTEAMYRSSAKLVRYLAKKYDVPLDREHIVGHEQYHGLTPARAKLMHNDPGPFWDWEYYMQLVKGKETARADSHDGIQTYGQGHHRANAVTIAPRFATNKPEVSQCVRGVCTPLPAQSANFVHLRTEPRNDAPLLTDAGLHPDGAPGTTDIDDWSAVATYGQRFAVAGKQGDWTAIWFNGQKGWFYNPAGQNRTAKPTKARLVTPKAGKASVPLYGRPVPEAEAYKNGVPPLTPVALQYNLLAGQSYVAYDPKAKNDYYHVATFDRSSPGDGTIVVGNEKYIPVSYNHRQAFVKASDVDMQWR